jgi:Fe-S cluster assembly protein SufD
MIMQTSDRKEQFLADYEAFTRNGAAADPTWLGALRNAAIERFADSRFPTIRDEEWRFTNVQPIAQGEFRTAHGAAAIDAGRIMPYLVGSREWSRLVFVDGRFSRELTLMNGAWEQATVANIADAARSGGAIESGLGCVVDAAENAFVALNTAFVHDGAYVEIPAGVTIDEPLHLLFVSTGAEGIASHPRVLIVAGRSSSASVVESYVSLGAGRTLTNAVTEVIVEENASVSHVRLQRESESAYHIATLEARQGRDSRFDSFNLVVGGALTRNNLTLRFGGEGIESWLNGLYVVGSAQHVDNHTFIDHAVPHCNSHELYKGILTGDARAVFSGKVLVREDAQKTDAKQTNRNLLLSKNARVNTKPMLEIFADDVKCTHGATVGQLDADALFYLRSRGMSPAVAKVLLTHGFAMEALDRIANDALREEMDRIVLSKLEGNEYH